MDTASSKHPRVRSGENDRITQEYGREDGKVSLLKKLAKKQSGQTEVLLRGMMEGMSLQNNVKIGGKLNKRKKNRKRKYNLSF